MVGAYLEQGGAFFRFSFLDTDHHSFYNFLNIYLEAFIDFTFTLIIRTSLQES